MNCPIELVSIIVPIYNGENFIDRCVRSVLKQTYNNIEIILVDDGSTDKSGKICDDYEKNYEQIHVFHKENGGLGSARNFGIAHANGQYICFVDCDDEVSSTYVEKLYFALCYANADISICGYEYWIDDIRSLCKIRENVMEYEEFIKCFLTGESLFNFAWNKMYRKNLIDRMPMLFEDRHCAEDMYFNALYYKLIDKAAIIEECLYKYYVNTNSLSNGQREGFWGDMLKIYDASRQLCVYKKIETYYADVMLIILLRNTLSNYYNNLSIKYSEAKQFLKFCLNDINISNMNLDCGLFRKVDRLFYYALKRNAFFVIFIYMKTAKYMKRNMLRTFCELRGNRFE